MGGYGQGMPERLHRLRAWRESPHEETSRRMMRSKRKRAMQGSGHNEGMRRIRAVRSSEAHPLLFDSLWFSPGCPAGPFRTLCPCIAHTALHLGIPERSPSLTGGLSFAHFILWCTRSAHHQDMSPSLGLGPRILCRVSPRARRTHRVPNPDPGLGGLDGRGNYQQLDEHMRKIALGGS